MKFQTAIFFTCVASIALFTNAYCSPVASPMPGPAAEANPEPKPRAEAVADPEPAAEPAAHPAPESAPEPEPAPKAAPTAEGGTNQSLAANLNTAPFPLQRSPLPSGVMYPKLMAFPQAANLEPMGLAPMPGTYSRPLDEMAPDTQPEAAQV